MAIDFSNRDPRDKNGVYSVRKATQNGWIEINSDGSWTGKFSASRPANTKGWQEVGYANVTLNDGRQFRAVLDGSGQPISEIGDPIGTDEDIARAFIQNRSPGERKPTRTYTGTDPQTGRPAIVSEWPDGPPTYEEIKPPAQAPRTPDQARSDAATATANEAAAATAQAEADERAWHIAQGHGSYTHKEWDQELARREREARAQGNQEAANQLARDRLAFDRERAAQAEAQANRPETKTETITRNGQTYTRVTTVPKDGSAPTIKNYGPDGQEVAAIPGEDKPGAYEPLPPGVPEFTPDLTQVDLGLGARRRQLDQLVNNGTITKAQAAATITSDSERAVTAGKNAGSIVNIQEGNRQAAITARGQDVQDASSRRSFAGSTFNQALSTLAPIGSSFIPGEGSAEAAAAGFMAALGLGDQRARALGAFPDIAPVDLNQYPALAAFGQAGIPGLPGGPPLSAQWPFMQPPTAAPAAPPAAPVATPPPAQPSPGGGVTINIGAPPQPTVGPDGITRSPDGTPYTPGVQAPTGNTYPGSWFTHKGISGEPVGFAGPGSAAQAFMQSAGRSAGYDSSQDAELQDVLRSSGFDDDVIASALMPPMPMLGSRLG